jgi:hypothetical protein
VGADGFRSSVRERMLPEVHPVYAGCVVWRALVDEPAIPDAIHRKIFTNFALFMRGAISSSAIPSFREKISPIVMPMAGMTTQCQGRFASFVSLGRTSQPQVSEQMAAMSFSRIH